ncbi:hypothetical protein TNCV_3159571 [Trichonephila clavipes]|nr:hypothetical protein TNCV_3159571 [Trichonephila clavipes]
MSWLQTRGRFSIVSWAFVARSTSSGTPLLTTHCQSPEYEFLFFPLLFIWFERDKNILLPANPNSAADDPQGMVQVHGLRSPMSLSLSQQRIVPLRHGGTLNSRRAASPFVRLVGGEESGKSGNPPPKGVLPQDWDGSKLNRTVTCVVLKANDRRYRVHPGGISDPKPVSNRDVRNAVINDAPKNHSSYASRRKRWTSAHVRGISW